MQLKKNLFPIAALISVAACSNGPGASAPPLGSEVFPAGSTYSDAKMLVDDFIATEIQTVGAAEGSTIWGEQPPTGDVTYSGALVGDGESGHPGPTTSYVANVVMTIDFATNDVAGTASDFTTDLAGFANPAGTVPFSGDVTQSGMDVLLSVTGSGSLVGTTANADVVFDTEGYFLGDNAQTVLTDVGDTTFTWTSGASTGLTSDSDTILGAVAQ